MSKGERLKKLREQLNITQDELAKRLSTTKQTIYKYENDIVTNIPSDRIDQLSKALHTSPAFIMGWTDDSEVKSQKPDPDPLTKEESRLIDKYRSLNEEGQEKLLDYADDLSGMNKYKKIHSVELVEEEA